MFYEQLSCWYDEVFPFNPVVGDFLRSVLPAQGRILDLACGTGSHSLFLADSGWDVVGVDLEPTMIQQARAKDHHQKAVFHVRDMLQCQDMGHFDAILCLGNSLAHLMGKEQVQAFFANAVGQLRSRGHLIVQIVNFDRILAQGPVELPLIETPNLVFRRTYTPLQDGRLEFSSELTLRKRDQVYVNRIFLNPIRSGMLAGVLAQHGFSAEFYGSYKKEPFQPNSSLSLIAAASLKATQ